MYNTDSMLVKDKETQGIFVSFTTAGNNFTWSRSSEEKWE